MTLDHRSRVLCESSVLEASCFRCARETTSCFGFDWLRTPTQRTVRRTFEASYFRGIACRSVVFSKQLARPNPVVSNSSRANTFVSAMLMGSWGPYPKDGPVRGALREPAAPGFNTNTRQPCELLGPLPQERSHTGARFVSPRRPVSRRTTTKSPNGWGPYPLESSSARSSAAAACNSQLEEAAPSNAATFGQPGLNPVAPALFLEERDGEAGRRPQTWGQNVCMLLASANPIRRVAVGVERQLPLVLGVRVGQ